MVSHCCSASVITSHNDDDKDDDRPRLVRADDGQQPDVRRCVECCGVRLAQRR